MAQSILWRRLDSPGHDSLRFFFDDMQWHVEGTAVFGHDRLPCRLDYVVLCDSNWHTQSARITGWVGDETIDVEISAIDDRWRLNGVEQLALAGCIDVDLEFSPSTNLLPIRRLRLGIGENAPVKAAWLRFPGFRLEILDQIYRRIDANQYRYETADGSFARDLTVNDAGVVTLYPGQFEAEDIPPAE
jgi:uncharacterized protein